MDTGSSATIFQCLKLSTTFDPKRGWKFDFAWPGALVALEIEGGHWIGGHVGSAVRIKDLEKYNADGGQVAGYPESNAAADSGVTMLDSRGERGYSPIPLVELEITKKG